MACPPAPRCVRRRPPPTRCPRLWHRWAAGRDLPFPYALAGLFLSPASLRRTGGGLGHAVSRDLRGAQHDPPYVTGRGWWRERRIASDTSIGDVWSDWNRFYGYDPSLRIWLDIGSGLGYSGLRPAGHRAGPADRGRQELEKTWRLAHGLPVWDQAWLEAFTGLKPKPLPEDGASWPDRIREFYAKLSRPRNTAEVLSLE
jgi:hypothetical protein